MPYNHSEHLNSGKCKYLVLTNAWTWSLSVYIYNQSASQEHHQIMSFPHSPDVLTLFRSLFFVFPLSFLHVTSHLTVLSGKRASWLWMSQSSRLTGRPVVKVTKEGGPVAGPSHSAQQSFPQKPAISLAFITNSPAYGPRKSSWNV